MLPPTNASATLHPNGASVAAAAVATAGTAAAALGGGLAATTAVTNASSTDMEVSEVAENPNSDDAQEAGAGAGAGATPSSDAAPQRSGGAVSVPGAPVPEAMSAPAAGGNGTATGEGGSTTQGGGGEAEKRALESAWNFYIQVTIICGLCLPCALSRPGPSKDPWLFSFYVLPARVVVVVPFSQENELTSTILSYLPFPY